MSVKDLEQEGTSLLLPASSTSPGRLQWKNSKAAKSSAVRGGLGVWRPLATVAACLCWMAVSAYAILVNKQIMVGLKFPYPVTVAWMGLLTTTVASTAAVHAFVPANDRTHLTARQYLRRVLPTGFCMALTFQTGNLSYLYLTLAFIQMLKAFCPVITMVLLFAFKLEKPTTQLTAAVLVISCGVALASWGEVHMSWFGLASMLTSVVAESVRLVLTQYLLVGYGTDMHPLEGLMYIGSASTLCLMLQACVWELRPMLRTAALLQVGQHPLAFLTAACAGFGVNLLAILVIKLASSLTLKVLGTVKDACLVTIGIIFLHEHVSQLQLIGYSVSVCGFVAYNYIKARSPLVPATKSFLPITSKRA